MGTIEVRQAEGRDRDVAARSLASAFADDPLMRWMTHDRPDPERRFLPFYVAILRQHLRRADPRVYVPADRSGAAIWAGVREWRMSTGDALRVLPASLRTFGIPNRALRVVRAIERVHPREPHLYLEILGVRRDRQGTGLGSALLSDMLGRCDREAIPTYLEVSNPRNIPFYARHGYEERESVGLGDGAPSLTTMWREPKST